MAKRRLTHKQKANIRKQRQRPQQLDLENLSEPLEGRVISHFGTEVIVEDTQGTRHRCHFRANLDNLLVGDRVIWRRSLLTDSLAKALIDEESNETMEEPVSNADSAIGEVGVIEQCLPRHSVIERPDHRGKLRGIAANITQVIIVIAPHPKAFQHLIDRYLIAIEQAGLKAVLVLNKVDLDADLLQEPRALLSIYQQINYTCVELSAVQQNNIDALLSILRSQHSIFVGQSGTGKSTLINSLLPEVSARTGELSGPKQKGRHTTTHTQYYRLNDNPEEGSIIDSPGIREFGLDHINHQQLLNGFHEFQAFVGQCRFRNCKHLNEPGCAIASAAELGEVHMERLSSYRFLYQQIADG